MVNYSHIRITNPYLVLILRYLFKSLTGQITGLLQTYKVIHELLPNWSVLDLCNKLLTQWLLASTALKRRPFKHFLLFGASSETLKAAKKYQKGNFEQASLKIRKANILVPTQSFYNNSGVIGCLLSTENFAFL